MAGNSYSCHRGSSACPWQAPESGGPLDPQTSDDDEHEWIIRTCRKGWDEIVGHRPKL
ncbi:Hypothetical predicted protein [Marmota monax]|uniref:Uncharacterized protein n=1 Tax=Marmota monax TaxID=9995 RepID=A0A5E4BHZ9_MARMO|nr:hypothetical protein GHT09_005115 [Marmota monax]VTJ69207.1 Hypothetical predicted protein [Marmota monax]